MLNDLNDKQKELASFMSKLSEEAFYAGWMQNLEFNLWFIMKGKLTEYGRLEINQEIINRLQKLSSDIDGWIYFDEVKEETFINIEDWKTKIKNLQ